MKQIILFIFLSVGLGLSTKSWAQAPTITSFTPTSGAVGATVTITGTGFNTTPANNIVFFGATRATVTAATATSLTVTVPIGATYGAITELNTATSLAAYSTQFFNPTFSPNKSSITTADIAAKVDFATGTNPFSVAIGDLDGDGKPDLAVANFSSASVSVYRNTSSSGSIAAGSFAAKVDFATGDNPFSVAIGDLDGDGKPDLAVANQGSATVSVYRNTSTSGSIAAGSFAANVDFATGSTPRSVAIGDVDGDGKPDLAVANQGSNTVSVYRNTSTSGLIVAGSFAAKVDFTTGTNPRSVAIGDLDGDGKPDLAVANSGSATVSVYRNTSSSGSIVAGSFAAKVDFTTGTQPLSVAIGDLDGDGKPDLALANYGSATVSVYRNSDILSSNADLSALALSTGTLTPTFASGTTAYTASVSNATTSITVTPTRAEANATITVNGTAVTSGSASGNITLTVGANVITTIVTAQDGTTLKTYTLTVTRAKADQTITFPALANKTTSDVDYEPGATVNSGLALRYTSSNTAVATVYQDATDGNKWKISIQGSGTTDITAIQDGNSDYNSASFLRALTVGIPLPVTLVSYDAKLKTNGTVQLTWLTASETNNSYFELQRSTDGISFTTIGKVTGAGNSTQEKRYNFTDLSPLAGTNYYKLLQYDKDGKKTDLGVRSVKVLLKENELTVYPNPSNGMVNVSFDINSYQKVELVDLTGKILMTKTIGKQASTISFDLSDLSAGVYNIRLTGEGKLAIKQIVKH
jgi:hypothetical protein